MQRMLFKRVRMARGLSQRELAALVPCHPNDVSAIERGRVNPYSPRMDRLAEVLGWRGDVDLLFRADLTDTEIKEALADVRDRDAA